MDSMYRLNGEPWPPLQECSSTMNANDVRQEDIIRLVRSYIIRDM